MNSFCLFFFRGNHNFHYLDGAESSAIEYMICAWMGTNTGAIAGSLKLPNEANSWLLYYKSVGSAAQPKR